MRDVLEWLNLKPGELGDIFAIASIIGTALGVLGAIVVVLLT